MEFVYICPKCQHKGNVSGEGGGVNYYPKKWPSINCNNVVSEDNIYYAEKDARKYKILK